MARRSTKSGAAKASEVEGLVPTNQPEEESLEGDGTSDDVDEGAAAAAGLRAARAANGRKAPPRQVEGAYVPLSCIRYMPKGGSEPKTERPVRTMTDRKGERYEVPNLLTDLQDEDVAQFLKSGAIKEHLV